MVLELIATIFGGIAAAGLMMLLRQITGKRLPGWLVPVAAALTMLGVTIASEYSWFSRTTASLPDGFIVAETVPNTRVYRPWTYVVPYTDRFVAVDSTSLQRHPDRPDQRMVALYLFGRWAPIQTVPVVVDCSTNQRADIVEGATILTDGSLSGATWITLADDDPILTSVCVL